MTMFVDANAKNVFFTSDTHLFHKNVIEYCNRPFEDITEMNNSIISNWNNRVKPNDVVFHLGDFLFSRDEKTISDTINVLNGTIYLIPGNHDSVEDYPQYILQSDKFIVLNALQHVRIRVNNENVQFVLCHYAMKVWYKSHYNSIHLYGHSHNSMPDDPNSLSMDVGVDANNFTPISVHDVLEKMSKKDCKMSMLNEHYV